MRAILIDPKTKTITEIDFDGDYRSISRLIECNPSPFTVVNLPGNDTLFVDDEGLLKDPEFFFHLHGYHHPLAGKGLILGTDDSGESTATDISLETLHNVVSFSRKRILGFETTERKGDVLGRKGTIISCKTIYEDRE